MHHTALFVLLSATLSVVSAAYTSPQQGNPGTPVTPTCPAGQIYSSRTGCTDCAAGTMQVGTSCVDCEPNTFSPSGSTQCSTCPVGTDSTGYKRFGSCNPCAKGSFYTGSKASCAACPAGSYTDTTGSSVCKPCECGTYQSSSGKSSCTACPFATYQGYLGVGVSPPGSDSSTDCIKSNAYPGYFYDSNKCPVRCPAGTFSSSIQSGGCSACPANSVSPTDGATMCNTCATGTQPNTAKTTCTPTPTGKMTPPYRRARDHFMCPNGLDACRIVSASGSTRAGLFECIDTTNNVESCGGCPSGAGGDGVDCTAVEDRHVVGASCVRGQCQYQCAEGFTMGSSGCERVAQVNASTAGEAKFRNQLFVSKKRAGRH